jgi:hypothetical protein
VAHVQHDPPLFQSKPVAHHHPQRLRHVLHLLPATMLRAYRRATSSPNPRITLRQKQIGPNVIIYARPQ